MGYIRVGTAFGTREAWPRILSWLLVYWCTGSVTLGQLLNLSVPVFLMGKSPTFQDSACEVLGA